MKTQDFRKVYTFYYSGRLIMNPIEFYKVHYFPICNVFKSNETKRRQLQKFPDSRMKKSSSGVRNTHIVKVYKRWNEKRKLESGKEADIRTGCG